MACKSCGMEGVDGICSMCYGDPWHNTDGEYLRVGNNIRGSEMTVTNYEYWFKLLMCANRLGIYITDADGHRWIESEPTDHFDYNEVLGDAGVSVNNKIYGGYTDALMVIDESLRLAMGKGLLDVWEFGEYEIGNGVLDPSRIARGAGGLY